jgi:hypothetical protein
LLCRWSLGASLERLEKFGSKQELYKENNPTVDGKKVKTMRKVVLYGFLEEV